MASAKTLLWIERLVWILIYGGLLTLVLGLATLKLHAAAGWSLVLAGGSVAAAGVVLIWLRSRLEQTG